MFKHVPLKKPKLCFGPVATRKVVTTVRDGVEVVSHVVSDEIEKLPKFRDFSLEKQLAAGLPMSIVNTCVLDSEPSEQQITDIVNKICVEPKNGE